MTIEEAKQLIDGEVYLFKYSNRIIKRMIKGIEVIKNNYTGITNNYFKLSTYEPSPTEQLYNIEHLELIGVYKA